MYSTFQIQLKVVLFYCLLSCVAMGEAAKSRVIVFQVGQEEQRGHLQRAILFPHIRFCKRLTHVRHMTLKAADRQV